MTASRLPRVLARLGGWPRRIAALGCLLLAAVSAVSSTTAPNAPRPGGASAHLARDEVAVPVPVAAASAALVRSGDRIGVLAAPDGTAGGEPSTRATLVADRLRVLAVRADSQAVTGDAGAVVVVAARRTDALALAQVTAARLVLIVDDLP